MAEFTKIGNVSRSYGNQGEVFIKIFSDAALKILDAVADGTLAEGKVPPLYMLFDGIYTPFFVQSCTPKGNTGFIVRFSTVSDASHAEELVGLELFAQGDQEDLEDLQVLKGYSVENESGKKVGVVADVIEYPANICLIIKKEDSSEEVLIPFHPDLLVSLDKKAKRMVLKIAQGLL